MSDTELRVICRECGSEVSPYVTECPYCGARVRKRAPELEHHDDHFEPKMPVRRRFLPRLPKLGLRPGRSLTAVDASPRQGAAIALHLAAAAVLLVIATAADWTLPQIGAILGPVEGEWWRLVTAQFAYENVGYLFAIGVVLVIFGPGIERQIGALATFVFLVLAGAAGAGVGYLVNEALDVAAPWIAGGNAVALASVTCWLALRRAQPFAGPIDRIGVAVVLCALLLLSWLVDSADIYAGLAGAAFGGLVGLAVAGVKRNH
jgi:membrane associated rhomboid family serine protease